MRAARARRAPCLALVALAAAACTGEVVSPLNSTREEQPHPNLKVAVVRPKVSDSGIVRVGTREEIYYTKQGGKWVKFGAGSNTGYFVLGENDPPGLREDATVLFHLGPGTTAFRVGRDGVPQELRAWLGRKDGSLSIPGNGYYIDLYREVGPHEARVERYDLTPKRIGEYAYTFPADYSDCQWTGLAGYGTRAIPYVAAQCKAKSEQAACLLAGPEGFLHVVARERFRDCGDNFPRARVNLTPPARFRTLD